MHASVPHDIVSHEERASNNFANLFRNFRRTVFSLRIPWALLVVPGGIVRVILSENTRTIPLEPIDRG